MNDKKECGIDLIACVPTLIAGVYFSSFRLVSSFTAAARTGPFSFTSWDLRAIAKRNALLFCSLLLGRGPSSASIGELSSDELEGGVASSGSWSVRGITESPLFAE